MKLAHLMALIALTALASCSEAEAEKSQETEKAEEVNLIGYWKAGFYEIAGKSLYLQFNQDGTLTHNRSFKVGPTRWMLIDNNKMIMLTVSPNDIQHQCSVDINRGTLTLKDAGCLPGYSDVKEMKGKTISYTRQ